MATIQNINVSTPNDNLGDTLRDSMVISNNNFAELNDKKVEKVSGKDLSSNDYTTDEKDKLTGIEEEAQKNVQANWNQNDDTANDYIIGKPTDGRILIYGTFSIAGETLTINAGWAWVISNVIYTNSSPIISNIPYCDSGLLRLDLIVFNELNSAERVEGDEVASDPVTSLLPENTVLMGIAYIDDSSVSFNSISNTDTLPMQLDFEANGIDNFIDIGTSAKAKSFFYGSVLQIKDDWSQSGTIINFTFIPDAGLGIKNLTFI